MKVLTAYTHEIDDVRQAVSEVLSQLGLEQNLCSNSAGIISCYPEFIDSGVVAALCAELPFETVGCTTIANSSAGELGFTMLTLTVLTGNDVAFAAALSGDLSSEQENTLKEAYERALSALPGKPEMVMVYGPVIGTLGGEPIVDMMDKACGGIPVFGTLALDRTEDYRMAQTIHNGKGCRTELSMLLISGNIKPRFVVTGVSEKKILRQKAFITKSAGNVLIEVNGMPFLEYMSTLGLGSGDGSIEGANTLPLIVDYNDGTAPVTRAIYMINGDGHAVCAGNMPEGSALSVGTLEYSDIAESAQALVAQIQECDGKDAIIMYSCLARMLILGFGAETELKAICSGFSIPYSVAYSGGEICPVGDDDGTLINRLHNFSIVSCLF